MASTLVKVAVKIPRFFRILLKVSLLLTSLLIFTKGFLLTRFELETTNTNDDQIGTNSTKKVVFLVIDALRYDFALFNSKLQENMTPPYRNKLKVFHELAKEKGCSKARLFKFVADAPTTTMQRLKGLTTGGFPTFIDLSSNFDKNEITEDNIIDRIKNDVIMMGDDTWTGLFPGRFKRSFPFPSFDVKDLHLVDNGILENLDKEILKKDWKFMIAHFLGVDHCGHRYGPNHIEMSKKLKQMNQVIENVIKKIDNDTILLVLGDHGMTQTGDHGGDSNDEVVATLFAYSHSAVFNGLWRNKHDENCLAGEVQQIDLVPTIANLMNVNIPFSNLGSVITDLLPYKKGSLEEWKAIKENAEQIISYINVYNEKHNLFKKEELQKIRKMFKSALNVNESDIENFEFESKNLLQVMMNTREKIRSIWAKFDVFLMTTGIIIFFTSIVFFLCSVKNFLFWSTLASYSVLMCLARQKETFLLLSTTILIILNGILASLQPNSRKNKLPSLSLALLSVTLIIPTGITSNSFVINEDVASFYLYSSTIVCIFIASLSSAKVLKNSKLLSKLISNKKFLATIVLLVLLRYIRTYYKCRPEQFWCYDEGLESEELGSRKIEESSHSLLASSIMLMAMNYVIRNFVQKRGNSSVPMSAASICKYALPLANLLITVHWFVQSASKNLDTTKETRLLLSKIPQLAFIILIACLVSFLISPFDVHLLYPDKYGNYYTTPTSNYQMMKKYNTSFNSKEKEMKPMAFGLFTLLSSSLIGFGQVMLSIVILLSDYEYSIVFCLMVASFYLFLQVPFEIYSNNKSYEWEENFVDWSVVSAYVLSSATWFYMTGHQSCISCIPWNSAYVGVVGSHSTVVLPFLMVASNVFASNILHAFLLPLLLLWPRNSIKSEHSFLMSKQFTPAAENLITKYIVLNAFKLFGSMLSCFLHNRHLMVWSIFAPRFLYELLSFVIVCSMSLFMYIFLVLFVSYFKKWLKKVDLEC